MDKPFLGTAYYPEDWDEKDMYYDIDKMKEAGIKAARIAEFAWSKMEPEKGKYDFIWLHKVVDTLAANGIRTVMGTPTATPPVWFLREHPEAARMESNGVRVSHGGRRHCCSNVPSYQTASDEIVTKLAEEFGGDSNIIGWQIDNEIYAWGEGCCCEYCVNGFRDHLKSKYGTIENLNKEWNTNLFSQHYLSFDDIPPAVNTWHNPHIRFEWLTFQQKSHIRFINRQAAILRKYSKAPIGTDMMPVNGLDYEKAVENLDLVMFNHYNSADDLYKAVFWFDYLRTMKKVPFWNTETAASWNGSTEIGQIMKPEGFCRLNSWLPVALGGESNMYWLFRQHWAGHELVHGALLYPSGKPFHIFGEVRQTAEEFSKVSDFISGTEVNTEVAIHFTSLNWNLFEVQKIFNDFNYCNYLTEYFHKPICEMGIRPDVIGALKELDHYKLIFSPFMLSLCDQGLSEKIEKWVKEGGVWVVGPMSDIRNEIGAHFRDADTGMLERLTGCELTYSIPDSSEYVISEWNDGESFSGNRWHELYTINEKAESLVTVTKGHSAVIGKSVVFRIKIGKGEIILLGSLPSEKDVQKIVSIALEDAGIVRYETSGGISVIPRKGKDTKGLILADHNGKGGFVHINGKAEDLLTGQTVSGQVSVPPYGVTVLKKISE